MSMDTNCQSSSHEALWKDVEVGKENKNKYRSYQLGAIVLSLLLLSLALCVFSMKQFWTPSPGKVYDLRYKVVLDGAETDSMMEIDPANRVEIFRMGNGTEEVLEIHDFKNGMTGIQFAKQQRCYIKSQTKELPELTAMEPEDTEMLVDAVQVDDVPVVAEGESQVWVPSAEPIANRAFLLDSKISEICQNFPIHWIHPSPLKELEFPDVEDVEETPKVRGQRQVRDVLDHQPVNDYRDVGIELDNRLDERGYCCQHCRRGYRFCRRYHEPLGGYWPYPYYYQGGRVICQIVMPCNWWIARMLGRI
ncbi:hypothetical protein AGOR_G00023330 [Albula goreensis]|uniref:BRICHOS domain-containing protein n=1 Tax=Albula goreensis TaxID=1534307 RepID=A0A8T3E1C4_9TELE|nr:hypothetical protein AGOR_G00023330 [Albula goreensis]